MKDYEKLILFLEMQHMDVSPFLKLKKNELALTGVFDIFTKESYKAVITEKGIPTDLYKNNSFFMSLGKMKYSKKLSDMMLVNHKNGEVVTIKEIYLDDSLTEQEKQEIVYRGIERANHEYKRFMSYITINNQTILKEYSKLVEEDKKETKRKKLIKKNILFSYLLAMVLILVDVLFLQNSYLNEKPVFVFTYNLFLVLLLIIPFIKKLYLRYFSNRVSVFNQQMSKFFSKCDAVLNVNDRNFTRLEKDVYRYSNDTSKERTISYLQHTNKLLKKLDRSVEIIFKLNSIQIGEQVLIWVLRVINLIPLIGLGLLLLFAIV